jgi:hypothetical protein
MTTWQAMVIVCRLPGSGGGGRSHIVAIQIQF